MICKTEAIVLKSFDYRETSRIATFFTKDFGKVSGVLKGIRKDSRKFGSSVDQFTVNDIVYYRYRNSDLHLISQCDLREFYIDVRQDFKRTTAAHYVLELLNKIMPVEESNDKVYALLDNFLRSLGNTDDINKIIYFFQIKMLLYSGFRPHLDACLKCKKKIEGRVRFSLIDGGLVCYQCPIVDSTVHLISQGTVASILHIEKNNWSQCLKLKLSEAIKKELKYVLNQFLIFHLGKEIRSSQYLPV